MRTRFLLALLALLPQRVTAARPDSLNAARIRTNQAGLKVLLSWGLVSSVTGAVGWATADGEQARRFYQMNAFWGVTNAVIAGFGYRSAQRELQRTYTPAEAFKKYEATRRLFLINAGLDVLYVGTGLYLHARSQRPEASNPDLLRGYGTAVVLQGATLFVFDAAMYAVQSRLSSRWKEALCGVAPASDGVGLQIKF